MYKDVIEKNKIKAFIFPILVWYMLRITTSHVVVSITEWIENLTGNSSAEFDYLLYLLLNIVAFAMIVFYTIFAEKRQVMYENNSKIFLAKDIIIGILIGGIYISIHILTFCFLGECYLENGVFSYILIVYFILNIVHAFAEEMLFRGYHLINNQNDNKLYWIIMSALLFALSHELLPINVIDQFIFGLALAIIVVKKGNIILAVFLHATNNFFLYNIYGTLGRDYHSIFYWMVDEDVSIPILDSGAFTIFSRIALLFIAIFVIRRNNKIDLERSII